MSRVDQHLQHSIMGMLGSFWSRVVTDKAKGEVRAIATLAANAPDLRRLNVPMQKLASEKRALVDRVRVPFLDGDFVVVGPDLANVWRSSLALPGGTPVQIVRRDLSSSTPKSQILIGSNGRPLGSRNGHLLAVVADEAGMTGSETLYVLSLPPGLTPIVIATRFADRVLVQGIDFEVGPGYLVMRESPGALFIAGGFTVITGVQETRLPYDFTMQVNGHSYGHAFVAAYYKGSSSSASFARAAAQAAGLLVLEQDDTLVTARALTPEITRYVFLRAGPVDIDYPHVRLVPGFDYSRGFIVSNGFRVISSSAPGWLRRSVGSRAVTLDGVMSVAGLVLNSGLVTAYHVERGAGGKPHARIQFDGSDDALLAAWSFQKNHELNSGAYLSDVIGLSPTVPKVAFDMHAILEGFYGSRLLLVTPELNGAPATYQTRLLEFIAREKPLGSVILVTTDLASSPPVSNFEPLYALSALYDYKPEAKKPDGGLSYDNMLLAYDSEVLVYGAT